MNIQIDASSKNTISNNNVNSILIKSYDEVRDEIAAAGPGADIALRQQHRVGVLHRRHADAQVGAQRALRRQALPRAQAPVPYGGRQSAVKLLVHRRFGPAVERDRQAVHGISLPSDLIRKS